MKFIFSMKEIMGLQINSDNFRSLIICFSNSYKNIEQRIFFHFQNVAQTHPYHIDTIIQLSEVFRMSEDMQIATEFMGSFHTISLLLCLFKQ